MIGKRKIFNNAPIAIIVITLLLLSRATAQTVWLAPVNDMRAPAGFTIDPDFPDLFADNAPWPRALKHTDAFEIVRRYIESQPDDKLRNIFSFLKTRHVALGIVFGVIPANNCGQGIEGMAMRPDENLLVARRLKKLGADLQYIVVDEPLHFGHYSQQPAACRYSIAELAQGFAKEINDIRSVYPSAKTIDVEPLSGLGSADELREWLDGVNATLGGSAPNIMRFDVQWAKPWKEEFPPILTTLEAAGWNFGVIYNGSFADKTDDGWIKSAQLHIVEWEGFVKKRPAQIVFQSWNPNPQHLLPETDPQTLPYLVDWYCAQPGRTVTCR